MIIDNTIVNLFNMPRIMIRGEHLVAGVGEPEDVFDSAGAEAWVVEAGFDGEDVTGFEDDGFFANSGVFVEVEA